jgi:CHAT domain-containing protein
MRPCLKLIPLVPTILLLSASFLSFSCLSGVGLSVAVAQTVDTRKSEADRLLYQGAIQSQSNQLQGAIQSLQQALVLYRMIKDRRGEGTALIQLGFAYDGLGDYKKAISFLEEFLVYIQELDDRLGEGVAFSRLGSAYLGLGQYNRAIQLHQQSLAIAQAIKNRAGESQELRNLGIAYYSLKQYDKAIVLYQQSLAIAKSTNDLQAEGVLLVDLGTAYTAFGKSAQAIDWLQQGLAIVRKIRDHQGEISALGNLGLAYQAQGDYTRAIDVHRQSLAIAQKTKDLYAEGIALHNIGRALFHSGQLPKAERTLQACIQVLEKLRTNVGDNDAAKISIFDQQIRSYRTLQEILIAQQKIDQALEISEQSRARAFVDLLAQRLAKRTTSRREMGESRGREIVNPPNLQQIRQIAAAQNATLVKYSILYNDVKTPGGIEWQESLLYIWVVKPTGEITFRQVALAPNNQPTPMPQTSQTIANSPKTCSSTPLSDLVTQTQQELRAPIANSPRSNNASPLTFSPDPIRLRRQLSQLHHLLITPIANLLPTDPNDQVIFIPQGALFFVPFPALRDGNGQYLIEKHTIRTAPSIQVLELTQRQRQKLSKQPLITPGTNALIVGNPSPLPGNWSSLPNAEEEAKVIAQRFGTQPLLGSQATKSVIKQKMVQARLIHLAAHGQFDDQQGLGSFMVLSGTDPKNSFLTAEELLDMNLQAELVVLSACQSGLGKLTGDGVIGLSRSLISAGVPSVMVSLWNVPDDSTNLLMTEFYQHLEKNSDKAQALRQAMLTLKNRNPIDWAAFTLIGEAR